MYIHHWSYDTHILNEKQWPTTLHMKHKQLLSTITSSPWYYRPASWRYNKSKIQDFYSQITQTATSRSKWQIYWSNTPTSLLPKTRKKAPSSNPSVYQPTVSRATPKSLRLWKLMLTSKLPAWPRTGLLNLATIPSATTARFFYRAQEQSGPGRFQLQKKFKRLCYSQLISGVCN